MDVAGAVRLERGEVFRRRIPFVPSEVIFGESLVVLARHQTVPCHLRDNRGGGDRERPRIAFDQSAAVGMEIRDRQTIYQNNVDSKWQGGKSAAHRLIGSLQDIDAVDLRRINDANTDMNRRVGAETLKKAFPCLWG